MSLRDALLEFVDERIDSLLRVPEMWGPEESIELQLLLLLEVRLLTLSPSLKSDIPLIQQGFIHFVRSKFPGDPPEPLAVLLARHGRTGELAALLWEFVETERRKTEAALSRFPSGLRLLDDEPDENRPPRHDVS